jgi:hypothetical protein
MMTNESHNPKQNRGKDMDRVSHMTQIIKLLSFNYYFRYGEGVNEKWISYKYVFFKKIRTFLKGK